MARSVWEKKYPITVGLFADIVFWGKVNQIVDAVEFTPHKLRTVDGQLLYCANMYRFSLISVLVVVITSAYIW